MLVEQANLTCYGQSYARVTIIDSQGASGRACPRHAVAALDGISQARDPSC